MALVRPRFPQHDLIEFKQGFAYYRAAAICRRGHVARSVLTPGDSYPDDSKCVACGALILTGCPSCQMRIRGKRYSQAVLGGSFSRPSFCDCCGAAYPWATKEERIYELENILDEEDMDEADRVFIHDRLRELREAGDLDEKRERQLWTQIRDRSGKFIKSEPVQKIAETLITAAVRNQLSI
ncbi:DUF2321 domain-containing protein [Micromonospora echinaurantiaca]|uniref:DUF2321 domain-containing protein n=1 Tax=Micromonospora echinaurantiaca TaxID=47857 RepID=UPI0037103991